MKLLPKTIERRGFLAGAVGFLAVPAARAASLPVPASNELRFKIFRNGTPIGEQQTKFTQEDGKLKVSTQADMAVKLAGITIFRYTANVVEYWLDDQFHQLNSRVNHNGDQLTVLANKIPQGFAIESTKAGDYHYTGDQEMIPMTYWNKAMLKAMILNIETGHHYPAIVESPGWNWLPTVDGGKILAQRFDVTGKLHFSVWYGQDQTWDGLAFNVHGQEMFQKYTS